MRSNPEFSKSMPEADYNMKTTLDKLKMGGKGIITNVGGEGSLRRRLLDMGLTPNTLVMVRKVAPLGDPIELHLRNYELTIRQEDAGKIEVTEVAE
ncbi:MAG: ferrous iron transport protein [Bacillota bacterium]|jgi:Fe2+ transport system protein FeoA|nr:ferrous iron transport protein [Bacillota bacterium]